MALVLGLWGLEFSYIGVMLGLYSGYIPKVVCRV